MDRFTSTNIVVTGGNSGIGLATALAFANEGARLAITGRDQDSLDQASARLGPDTIAIRSDAGSPRQTAALADRLRTEMGSLDAVFVNAGIAKFAPLAQVDTGMWDATFDVNVKGAYFTVQHLSPLLRSGGSIVLNGSINAHIGMPGSSVYAASKAALISLARTLSAELLEQGVRVNVVSPGPITTPIYGRLGLPDHELDAMSAGIQGQIPIGRFGRPAEIANAVLYLASEQSSFVVGTELVVDGGMSQL